MNKINVIIVKILFILYSYVNNAIAQNLPSNPCPQLFQYQFDGNNNGYIGVLDVPSDSSLSTIRVNVEMSLGAQLSSNYVGVIDLFGTPDEAAENARRNRPIRHRVTFPIQNPLPKLTEVSVNGNVICSGPPVTASYITTIRLDHTVYPQNSNTITHSSNNGDDTEFQFGNNNFNLPTYKPNPNNIFLSNSNNNHNNNNNNRPQQNRPTFSTSNVETEFIVRPINTQINTSPTFDFTNFHNNFQNVDYETTTKRKIIQPHLPIYETSGEEQSQQRPKPTSSPPAPSPPPTKYHRPSQSTHQPEGREGCGQADETFRSTALVVGGTDVIRGSWPWMAAIYLTKATGHTFQCGGNLLSTKVVLSAAHCFVVKSTRIKESEVIVFLGRYDIQKWMEEGSTVSEVERIHIHDDYKRVDKQSFDADIAVLILKNRVRYNEYIRPICLWTESTNFQQIDGQFGTVVGWGRDENGNSVSAVPKKIDIPIVGEIECLRSKDIYRHLTSNRTYCAGARNGVGPCNGDSGSGMILERNGRWTIRGLVSSSLTQGGTSICNLDEYLIFTDVAKFNNWISNFMNS